MSNDWKKRNLWKKKKGSRLDNENDLQSSYRIVIFFQGETDENKEEKTDFYLCK